MIVILRSLSFSMVREAITPGTPHPDADQHRNEGFTGQTEFAEDTVHDKCNTGHVTAGLQECKEEEQYQHLRYETKYSANTGNNTIQDQSLQPVQHSRTALQCRSLSRRRDASRQRVHHLSSPLRSYQPLLLIHNKQRTLQLQRLEVQASGLSRYGQSCQMIVSFFPFADFDIALSDNGRNVYITFIGDNTLCIIIKFLSQVALTSIDTSGTLFHLFCDLARLSPEA